jgi:hypothetical protein
LVPTAANPGGLLAHGGPRASIAAQRTRIQAGDAQTEHHTRRDYPAYGPANRYHGDPMAPPRTLHMRIISSGTCRVSSNCLHLLWARLRPTAVNVLAWRNPLPPPGSPRRRQEIRQRKMFTAVGRSPAWNERHQSLSRLESAHQAVLSLPDRQPPKRLRARVTMKPGKRSAQTVGDPVSTQDGGVPCR